MLNAVTAILTGLATVRRLFPAGLNCNQGGL
jgi:hypothetical protein